MAHKNDTLVHAEQLVRDILAKNFNQKIKAADLKNAAQKVADTLPAKAKAAA